jgi:CRISPR-associated Csx3 family protein
VSSLSFDVTLGPEQSVVRFTCNGMLDPSCLTDLAPPEVPHGRGVVLSGGGPTWLYVSLVSTYRAHPWVAIIELTSSQAVVVYTRDRTCDGIRVGSMIKPLPAALEAVAKKDG